ncbi:MAG: MBL fold metallo-hydrolase [Betaproteobacteria bacterium]
MSPTITFHGAAGCVTGFCVRLETDRASILIDCGMFQGSKTLKALNYEPFPFDIHTIDAVVLTHAHIDHSGLLPKLMRSGYQGPIFATAPTRQLCAIMLADAGGIQENEVEYLNRRNQRRGVPAVEPIYTEADAHRTMRLFRTVKLGDVVAVAPGITARYWEAGHILGSASIEVIMESTEGPLHLLFSGDLGPGGRDYSPDPEGPVGIDHLVIESTYGNRERDEIDPVTRRHMLADELRAAQAAGGPMLIPAFAVERTQELLADLLTMMDDGSVPETFIFLDSPLAIEACEVFQKSGWNRGTRRNPFADVRASTRLKFMSKKADSIGIERLRGWHIIMAGSGMCDAGRIRGHLKRLLWRSETTVLLAGYQAVGTLGRLLQDGAKRVRIQGEDINVKARIRALDVYSGHADATGLITWAQARQPVAGAVFLAHGEPDALQGLRERMLAGGFAANPIMIPGIDTSYALGKSIALTEVAAPGRVRIAPAAASALDWHNDRAGFLLHLNTVLQQASDDAARRTLLSQLTHTLTNNA